MRKLALAALALLVALPALAQDQHQSYITYDDGDSVLVQNDGRQVDARMNLPIYPGDELRAGARGRSEIRLADGNVLAIDRYTRLKFESLLGSFESDDTQTVVRLLEGQVVLYRLYRGSEPLRLDTANASYLADKESLYAVEMNSKGVDLVNVFEGSIVVRTRTGSLELSSGDMAKVDLTGVYSRNRLVSNGATEFEQWFIRRAGRYSASESRYLDASLAYVEADLNENGEWIYVNNVHVWRPYVSVGWRPYYNGYWYAGWGGTVAWVSYEPWGWYPYHYGRWAYHSYYGWVWYPGYGYSPAWVYWAWGPSWVGWAPAGWYDCYWGWNNWYYYPHYAGCHGCGHHRGYGFNGRVTVSTRDLHAYTVVNSGALFSNRIDRASLTADQVKGRLSRDGSSGIISNQGLRVTGDEMRDPSRVADRIIRGGNGSGTGNSQGTGSPADVTQFFQRDPNPSASVRDRVTRGVPRDTQTTQSTRGTSGGGTTLPGSSGSSADPGVVTRGTVGRGGGVTGGTVTRGGTGETVSRPSPTTGTRSTPGATSTTPREGVVRPRSDNPEPGNVDRDSGGNSDVRPRTVTRPTPAAPAPDSKGNDTSTSSRPRPVPRSEPAKPTETKQTPSPDSGTRSQDRPVRPAPKDGDQPVSRAPSKSDTNAANDDWRRGNAGSTDPAQRVITTIGGARISATDRSGNDSATRTESATRSGEPSGDSWRTRGSFTSGSRSDSSGQSATKSGSSTSGRSSAGVTRPSTRSSSGSGTTTTRSGSSSTGKSTATRSSGSSGSGNAGVSRPSSGNKSSGSNSGGSRSSGAKSPSNNSSSSSSNGKVTRNPD